MCESHIVNTQHKIRKVYFLSRQKWRLFCCARKWKSGEKGRSGGILNQKMGKIFAVKLRISYDYSFLAKIFNRNLIVLFQVDRFSVVGKHDKSAIRIIWSTEI